MGPFVVRKRKSNRQYYGVRVATGQKEERLPLSGALRKHPPSIQREHLHCRTQADWVLRQRRKRHPKEDSLIPIRDSSGRISSPSASLLKNNPFIDGDLPQLRRYPGSLMGKERRQFHIGNTRLQDLKGAQLVKTANSSAPSRLTSRSGKTLGGEGRSYPSTVRKNRRATSMGQYPEGN